MSDPIVSVKQGKLKGLVLNLVDGSSCYSFKGVPYAQPPIGLLRFKAPEPPQPWQGIFEATKHGPSCPQIPTAMLGSEEEDENCLSLNIYTKSLDPNSKLPVMVYIHGGAYMTGCGNSEMYGPDFLLQHDVILVTINYRLEVFGFLCLDTKEVPGNAGLKDQVAALKWVNKNISQFGGDPDNVTIFGESVGAASVTYHILSPMSKGLFHKVIAQSGTCIDDWSIQRNGLERAFRCSKLLGKETEDVNELLQHFRSFSSKDLIGLTLKTRTEDEKHRGLSIYFAPVVEKKFNGVESFLNEEPLDILLSRKYNKVPLMIGYNSSEGLLMLAIQLKKANFYNINVKYLVPREIASSQIQEDKIIELGERIKKFYVGNKGFGEETADAIVDLQTDWHFVFNVHRFVNFYLSSNQPIYCYRFNYVTDLNILKKLDSEFRKGASHADDLFYLFLNGANKDVYQEQDKLKQIVNNMTKMWTNFAKVGNPTPDHFGTTWPPTRTGKEFMNLEEPLSFGQCVEFKRVEFWNKLYSDAGAVHIPKCSL